MDIEWDNDWPGDIIEHRLREKLEEFWQDAMMDLRMIKVQMTGDELMGTVFAYFKDGALICRYEPEVTREQLEAWKQARALLN